MSSKRILVIDDEPDIRELAQMSLEMVSGWQVLTAESGNQGIAKAKQENPDAILLDAMMPDVDGYEVLRHIRANSRTADLPVIFLTAKSTPADIEKGVALGANHYITKPFSGLDLIRKVRLCLQARTPRDLEPHPVG